MSIEICGYYKDSQGIIDTLNDIKKGMIEPQVTMFVSEYLIDSTTDMNSLENNEKASNQNREALAR